MMIGQTVSHYKILEELGAGGMGVVYKAEDTKLKRTVALKFLPPELTRDKKAKTRFIHEAQAASALQHHNVCTIHEIDETEDGRMFISMDCYEGETLKDRIARGPLPAEQALNITIQVVEGLAKAHEAGMVHRDIKPANIMVTNDGVVKILDFGLAKLAGQTKLTKTGTTVGTVAYMSPEQARGEEVDAHSDIFSLGAVFYEMLTGHIPFRGDHEAAVLYGIMHNDPERLAAHRSDLPEQLQQIIDKALAKNTNERYENASDLLNDLTPWRPVRAAETTNSGFFPLRRGLKHIIAVSVAVVVIGAIAFIVSKQRSSTPSIDDLSLAIVDFRDLVTADNSTTSAEITGLLLVGLVESSPIRVVSPDYLHEIRRRLFGSSRGPIEEEQALEVARKSRATYVLSGQIKAGEYVTWRLVETESGKSLAARRVEGNYLPDIVDEIVGEVHPVIARECGIEEIRASPSVSVITTESPQAYKHYISGVLANEGHRNREAVRELNLAISYDSTFALAYLEMSRAYYGTMGVRDPEQTRICLEKAWELRTHLGVKDRMRLEARQGLLKESAIDALTPLREMLRLWPDDREAVSSLCATLYYFWYNEEALSVAKQGLAHYPDNVRLGGGYGACLATLGHLEDALEVAIDHVRRHPANPNGWDDLGLRWLSLGMPDSAEVAFRRAIELDTRFEISMALCAFARGDVDEAIEILERILARDALLDGERVLILAENRHHPSLSFLYAEAGRFKQSLEFIEDARQYISVAPAEIALMRNRAILLLRMGRAEEVLDWARSLKRLSDVPDARTFSVHYGAQALVALGRLDEARPLVSTMRDMEKEFGGAVLSHSHKLSAQIALAENKPKVALESLEEMKRLGIHYYGGLIDIEYRESVARVLQMAKRLDEAAVVHEDMLKVYAGHALSHYGLGKIYQELGRSVDAKREFSEFLEMWSEADEGLPQLVDARERLSALGGKIP
jgi:serine/threonine protein kinase/tetratricopeptide (TPR) repeat protein